MIKKLLHKSAKFILGENLFNALLIYRDNRELFKQRGEEIASERKEIIKEIEKNGFAVFPNYYPIKKCIKIKNEIDRIMRENSRYIQSGSDKRIHGSEFFSDHIKIFRDDPFIKKICKEYGQMINAWVQINIVKPSLAENMGSGEGWHRDGYARELKAIIYLTDCDDKRGCFHCIRGSHRPLRKAIDAFIYNLGLNKVRHEGKYKEFIANKNYKKITGNAGTLIIFDTSILHSGSPIIEGERYALTMYNLYKPGFVSESCIDKLLDYYAYNNSCGSFANKEKVKNHMLGQLNFKSN